MTAAQICHPTLNDPAGLEAAFFKRLGHSPASPVPPRVLEHARAALETGSRISHPVAVVKAAVVEKITGHAIHTRGMSIESALWAGLSARSHPPLTLVAVALTLGQALSVEISKARESSLSRAYFLHEAGSAIIETAADQLEGMIRDLPGLQGKACSRRFSPGYCDIPLAGQREFFRFLRPETIGIQLAASGGMRPEKSITAAILVAESLPARSPCLGCTNGACPHRRAGEGKGR